MLETKIAEGLVVNDFLLLPRLLYNKKKLVQNEREERQLLSAEHILSKYFSFTGFVCYQDGEPCARCAVTVYPEKDCAYIGFFECINDKQAAKLLFDCAEKFAFEQGRQILVGPVDASFWIKYRMKANVFEDRAYFSEPYNKDYYKDLWESSGYEVDERYISNKYERFSKSDLNNKRFNNRYNEFIKKGYEISSPEKKDWDKVVGEVYGLIIDLYSGFSVFSYISEEDFRKLFSSLKFILDFSMVKMAYLNGEAVGFFIGSPDYKNRLCGKIGLKELLYILLKRLKSKNYVMLYLGVKDKHLGLGKAMTQTIIRNVYKKNATSIGAFIKKGKVTEKYAAEKVNGVFEYLTFRKQMQ